MLYLHTINLNSKSIVNVILTNSTRSIITECANFYNIVVYLKRLLKRVSNFCVVVICGCSDTLCKLTIINKQNN